MYVLQALTQIVIATFSPLWSDVPLFLSLTFAELPEIYACTNDALPKALRRVPIIPSGVYPDSVTSNTKIYVYFERGQEDTKTAAPGESGVPPKEKGRRGMEPYTNINVKKIKL